MSSVGYSLPLSLLRSQANYIDLNSMIGSPGESQLLYDKQAIRQAILNIFKTTIGEAGPIFEPEFGSGIYNLLQEPFDDVTGMQIRVATIQALQRWEPRIELVFDETDVTVNDLNTGYDVNITYRIKKTGETASTLVKLPKL